MITKEDELTRAMAATIKRLNELKLTYTPDGRKPEDMATFGAILYYAFTHGMAIGLGPDEMAELAAECLKDSLEDAYQMELPRVMDGYDTDLD